jgi:DNA/RNA-binding domain of Phe-tRNA-synthetase-like protein
VQTVEEKSMNTLMYRVAPEVFAAHPSYCLGVVVFSAVDNLQPSVELVGLLRETEEKLRATVFGNVAEHPRLAAWREAFREFGAKPSEHRSSIEAMVRRVVKPDQLPSINPLVDVGNLISLRYLMPAGVHPLRGGAEVLELRRAQLGDTFVPAGSLKTGSPEEREIVLASEHEVLTRRWTWRQAAGTQTLPDTTKVFFNVDGLAPASREDVTAALHDVQHLVTRYCAGTIAHVAILDAANPYISLEYPRSPS